MKIPNEIKPEITTMVHGYLIGIVAGLLGIGTVSALLWAWDHRPQPCPVNPLQVTVLDDGGAKIDVTSTIEGCR